MPTATETKRSLPALPVAEEKRLIQAEVNKYLFEQVQREMKKRRLKIREVVEWGMRAFLDSIVKK